MAKRALIVIDVQNEYFDGALPISDPPTEVSLANVGRAMDAATDADVPVIVVRHGTTDPDSPIFKEGSHEWELHPEIERRSRDHLVEKTFPGSFTGTSLESILSAAGDRHRHDRRVHDPHVRRHDVASSGAPRSCGRDPQRRDRNACAREQRWLRRR